MDTDFMDETGQQIPVEVQDRSVIRRVLSTPLNAARRAFGGRQ